MKQMEMRMICQRKGGKKGKKKLTVFVKNREGGKHQEKALK